MKVKPIVLLYESGSDALRQTCSNIRGQRSDTASLRPAGFEMKWSQQMAGVAPLRKSEKEKNIFNLINYTADCRSSQIPFRHLLTCAGKLAQRSECELLRNPQRWASPLPKS